MNEGWGERAIAKFARNIVAAKLGGLRSCDIVKESPAGLGFAESTVRLSKLFQMKAADADGNPVAGRRLYLPVRWDAAFGR